MNSRASNTSRRILSVVLPMIAALAFASLGCSRPQAMVSASDVPASEGTVKTTRDDNNNTTISIRVKHLAPPSRVAADATVYIVWIQARDGAQQSLGELALNKNLEGSLDTVTPHRRFTISVTPESNRMVALPAHDPVFTSVVERKE